MVYGTVIQSCFRSLSPSLDMFVLISSVFFFLGGGGGGGGGEDVCFVASVYYCLAVEKKCELIGGRSPRHINTF